METEKLLNRNLANQMDRIEDEMVAPKDWTLKGEINAVERPLNSLLAEHLDFDVATKMAPKVTKEVNNNIEDMIKSRILEELFDDPIRKQRAQPKVRVAAEDLMDYEKNKKGLADVYEHDYKVQHLGYAAKPEEDATREEIDELFVDLFYKLDTLSNAHFTPKPVQPEAKITTQNVSAIMIEDKTPIIVSEAQTKSAREIYNKDIDKLAEKEELSKEEKKAARMKRKRKIRTHLHKKEIKQKEKLRQQDMAMNEKFETRQNNKKKKPTADEKADSKNEHKSQKFFAKMQDIGANDRDKKAVKKARGELTKNEKSKTFKL
jgi:U3 small nucleolar RNA-associated protein MPP10